jgi:tRNA nucleotidyltransferase (CCA-adding enzyme)
VVRDHLLGKKVKDWDIEVYQLDTNALERALRTVGKVNTVGRAFSVFKLRRGRHEIDVSLPRRDSNVGPGHRGIRAVGDPHMSLQDATRRRDLTINALMWDLREDLLIDVVGGVDDLRAGTLRMVDATTFLEDPLRALRMIQFAARLEFQPTEALKVLCQRATLDELPPERVLVEWTKLLVKGRKPSIGLKLARETQILARVFPEAAAADDDQVYEQLDHAVPARDACSDEAHAMALMLTIWLQRVSAVHREATLDRLRVHRWQGYALREHVLAATEHLHDPISTPRDLRWMSTRAQVDLVLSARRWVHPDHEVDAAHRVASALGILHQKPSRLLLGRHLGSLGVKPGPAMGRVLEAVYRLQLNNEIRDVDEARAAAQHWLGQQGS